MYMYMHNIYIYIYIHIYEPQTKKIAPQARFFWLNPAPQARFAVESDTETKTVTQAFEKPTACFPFELTYYAFTQISRHIFAVKVQDFKRNARHERFSQVFGLPSTDIVLKMELAHLVSREPRQSLLQCCHFRLTVLTPLNQRPQTYLYPLAYPGGLVGYLGLFYQGSLGLIKSAPQCSLCHARGLGVFSRRFSCWKQDRLG